MKKKRAISVQRIWSNPELLAIHWIMIFHTLGFVFFIDFTKGKADDGNYNNGNDANERPIDDEKKKKKRRLRALKL